ncbi:MAG TPA: endonuclease/exonuclease/phosphatase family protein [Polyangium sp.]|nr:endonuclease/exonuclease/phosphatase family protein [Polyangium sp.]
MDTGVNDDPNILTLATNASSVVAVPELYLFTWNLCGKVDAHDLAVEHLAEQASKNHLFIACFQELPKESAIAIARKIKDSDLDHRGLRVVQSNRSIRGAALVHHPSLTVIEQSVFADEDNEFMTAVFQLPSSPMTVGVVNLHASSRATVPNEIDRAGCRALLRQAINERRLEADHVVIMGDWNSEPHKEELNAYHTFYALPSNKDPLRRQSWDERRGLKHPPFYVPQPHDPHKRGGTYLHKPSQDNQCPEYYLYDFIAFRDKKSISTQSPQILTQLVAKDVWDDAKQEPCVSDHLPVEGFLAI